MIAFSILLGIVLAVILAIIIEAVCSHRINNGKIKHYYITHTVEGFHIYGRCGWVSRTPTKLSKVDNFTDKPLKYNTQEDARVALDCFLKDTMTVNGGSYFDVKVPTDDVKMRFQFDAANEQLKSLLKNNGDSVTAVSRTKIAQ